MSLLQRDARQEALTQLSRFRVSSTPEDPHSPGGRPMDLADHRRLHPVATCPAPGGRPAPALGETQPTGQARPRPHPPGLPAHPPSDHLPGPGTETFPARPRTTTRPQEHPTHTPPRRAHTPQNPAAATTNEEVDDPTAPPHRLKIKLGGVSKVLCGARGVRCMFCPPGRRLGECRMKAIVRGVLGVLAGAARVRAGRRGCCAGLSSPIPRTRCTRHALAASSGWRASRMRASPKANSPA